LTAADHLLDFTISLPVPGDRHCLVDGRDDVEVLWTLNRVQVIVGGWPSVVLRLQVEDASHRFVDPLNR
jgi:hypothetical protein